ncbi:MAG: UDP-4-amino-4,6-dideoxy-N-acetyl-beta-L-altrosamine transaminase [Candidatus Marinimicrobia bacterium]|nr:UDP-4-amino-4,6-dideoxy-N-acetyl-beta-L-altrosamine transaminase [Candidatus Neomarinimicrobiota bacterium]
MKKFFYGKQNISKSDVLSVVKSLKTSVISQGTELKKIEIKIAKYCGAKYCVAVSSGTAALHLSCLSLNLKKPFYGVTSPITFVATVNAMLLSGGSFDLIDIDKDDFNIDPNKLKNYIKGKLKEKKPIPKLIIPVHFAGLPARMEEIKKICNRYKIKIIEDASQALGATYNGKKIGCCKYSDITVFSLHPVKSITSGEGGLILTNSKQIYNKLLALRVNGIEKKGSKSWSHDMKNLGLNYKISEINCALANSQLERLNPFIKKRKSIAKFYKKKLNNDFFTFQKNYSNSESAFHLFIIYFKKKISLRKKNLFYEKLKKVGINLDIKYRPIQTFTYFKNNFIINKSPNSINYFKQSFCLPMYVDLKYFELEKICKSVNRVAKDLGL